MDRAEIEGDVRLLADTLGLRSVAEVLEVATDAYGDRLDVAARFFVEELFQAPPRKRLIITRAVVKDRQSAAPRDHREQLADGAE